MTVTITPGTIRPAATAVLHRDGWIQGNYTSDRRGRTGCCLVEAIGRGTGLPPLALARKKPRHGDADFIAKWDAAHNLMDEIATSLGRNPEDDELSPKWWLTNWNDRKGRTLDQVLEALEPAQENA
ncbi:hypothetical protein FAF44_02790 [Nonomuraea sp. MG754425]|uniref:DUF6197 family protein n=1 Tax=Nonomuraea sp. MG754425 TaxID=2570319 RepID=UPI001F452ABF|nr:hypothetical protein [Nonomuraea sp. MG754425]MCF6467341.1 hypothetical protein [Nonomuraea sp. MG754425]